MNDGMSRKTSPEIMNRESLSQAEKALARMGENYEEHVQVDLARLQKAFEDLKPDSGNIEKQNNVFLISHNISGLGDTFGYGLITIIGSSLCRFIERQNTLGRIDLEIILSHIEALKTVVDGKLKGEDHPEGQQILLKLKTATGRDME